MHPRLTRALTFAGYLPLRKPEIALTPRDRRGEAERMSVVDESKG
jgi:hypothetical protein